MTPLQYPATSSTGDVHYPLSLPCLFEPPGPRQGVALVRPSALEQTSRSSSAPDQRLHHAPPTSRLTTCTRAGRLRLGLPIASPRPTSVPMGEMAGEGASAEDTRMAQQSPPESRHEAAGARLWYDGVPKAKTPEMIRLRSVSVYRCRTSPGE